MKRKLGHWAFVLALLFVHVSCDESSSGVEPPPAPTPAVPAVVRVSAIGTTINSVILTGLVRSNQLATVCHFEYGASLSYGLRTKDHSVGPDTSTIEVRDTLVNLPAGSLYHFRLIASNSAGVYAGPDSMFTTLVDFIFPLALGTQWQYQYFHRYTDPPYGIVEEIRGFQVWQVVSAGSGFPPYNVSVSVERVDTMHNSHTIAGQTSDTTFVTQSQTSFIVSVTTDSLRVRWTNLMRLISSDSLVVGQLARSVPRSVDTLNVWVRGGYGHASYAPGVGLVGWNAALLGNHTWNEQLTLLSYTKK